METPARPLDSGSGSILIDLAEAFGALGQTPPPEPPEARVDHDVIAPSVVAQEFIDPQRFTNYYFAQVLCSNQIDIVGALTSQERTTITVEPRQVGKTSSVAVASAINCETEGTEWNKHHAEPYRIGIFAPKAAQAQLDTERLKAWARCTKQGRALINWELTTNDRLVWHNGCEIRTYSASEQAENDGKTLNRIILEEGQKISDFVVSQAIMPMGGATGAKISKIGTVRPIRNHFFNTWHNDPKALKTWHHWLICDNLLRGGYVEYGGRKISKYVLDMMPLAQKETYIRAGVFPNNSDFYYPSNDMELNDFLTQYELRWLEQFGLFIDGREKAILLAGSTPHQAKQMSMDEEFYVGIDFATGTGSDETAVAVWKRVGPILMKVWGCTWSDMPAPSQKRELMNLFSKQGPFHSVKLILGDFGGNGSALIPEMAEAGLPAQTINFGASDKLIVGASMNMKTSMFMDFKRQLQMGWLRYPIINSLTPIELTMDYQKGVRQWSALEQEIIGFGINRRIQAPESDHDDVCCADVLAVRAAKMGPSLFSPRRAYIGKMPYFIMSSNFK